MTEEKKSESLEDFLKGYKVRNSESTAQLLMEAGVKIEDLMEWREKDIEKVFSKQNVEPVSQADIFRMLRKLPGSCIYQEYQQTRNVSSINPQVVILHPKEYKKVRELEEKYKGILNTMDKLQNTIDELEENGNMCKAKVKECHELLLKEIEKYFTDLYIKIDTHKIQKKEIYLKQWDELKVKESQIKEWNDELSECINDYGLNVNERRNKILQLFQNPLISSIEWNDNLTVNNKIFVNTDIQSIIQLMKENLILLESYEMKLENPHVDISKDPPLVSLKWNENIPNIWKDNYTFEMELLSIGDLKEENKNNDDNKENENRKEIMKYNWKKIESNKIEKKEDGTLEFKYQLNRMEPYALRMRTNFFNNLFFTPFTDIQLFYTKIPTQLSIFGSSILTRLEDQMLQLYLPKKTESKVSLLFRGSRDGFSSSKFHELCDNKGATITIINSNQYNHVFGGFTNIPWSSNDEYKNDSESYIFLLRSSSQSITIPQKWNIKSGQQQYAVCHYINDGPIFGRGCDFALYDNCNTNTSNYSKFGVSYNGPRSKDILAGAYNFTVKDYEVYKVE